MKHILEQITLIKEKYDKIEESTGVRFNVFSLLKLETDEVRTHSRIIAELLNPSGSHSQGSVFLNLFLEEIGIKHYVDLELVNVEIEKSIGDLGRIDIYLKSPNLNIVIENKIYAPDQESQLLRYYKYVKDQANYKIIYLTLDGAEPKKYTLTQGEDKLNPKEVDSISYDTHIIRWLEKCINSVPRVPQVRENLYQYQLLLKKLTGQETSKQFIMEARNIFYKNNNVAQIEGLEEAIRAFKIDIHLKFWDTLKDEFINEEDLKYSVNTKITEIDREVISEYYPNHDKLRANNDFGIYFKVMGLELDGYSIYYGIKPHWRLRHGFRLFKDGKRSVECQGDDFKEIVKSISSNIDSDFKNDNSWLGVIAVDEFNFRKFDSKGIYSLANGRKDNDPMSVLVEHIKVNVEALKKLKFKLI